MGSQEIGKKISGAEELKEIASLLEDEAPKTTKCCATGTCGEDDD